ncbi:substrate-binding domain-containing protein [Ralstonia solanacearum]|uniref:substrate-binding domain-containing protein n=1 Tax=Ralstonia solanacearum TaxID=305 RepID=UPI0005C580D4|nr:substrate-binding domain-containing protein [Ralstonia solanacearum]MBB6590849.1 substrate-binding domain-containing protein [Ralstonia solanacearum]MBB6595046.1 substrate-binding domain-containing protein [Ralstonia solanacearum]MDB0541590.1 substrate-binding domain-containing protein [Ralstonia solanacearum]MDB0550898.1 substrate-binding domain-containing protein [Ralstonia solanacearum]MDB0556067.1 substrate-binding domain-containing protein [Ralstonia solanacearum]
MSKVFAILPFHTVLCMAFAVAGTAYAGDLRMATTTSTENSGLLKVLLPRFEAATGVHVQVIAVGTGKAVKLGEAGDVDVVLVHARPLEDAFVASGGGIDRRDVMYNDFILVGPAADPAHVRAQKNVIQGMEAIAAAGAKFVSRGDNSGTDVMEQSYWKTAGIDPKGKPWYVSAGLGMGEVLNMAAQMDAYTLSDRATYGAYRARTGLDIVLAGDPRMFNPYGIIAVNPARHPGVNYADATRLIEWITSIAGQQAIAEFKVSGEQVFFPNYGKALAGGK